MYVHLLVTPESADKLYPYATEMAATVGSKRVRASGVVVGTDLMDHFNQYSQAYLHRLDCSMELERRSGLFSLRYREYLPEVPAELVKMGIKIVGAELIRSQSAPTKARAGFYRWPQRNATATVERVFPTQHDQYKKPIPLYAQNIHIQGMSLKDVQEFNSKLAQGHFNRFLVAAWE